jgi:hypothetical protein
MYLVKNSFGPEFQKFAYQEICGLIIPLNSENSHVHELKKPYCCIP